MNFERPLALLKDSFLAESRQAAWTADGGKADAPFQSIDSQG